MQLGKHINISEPLEPEEGEEERNETSQEPLELEERERWSETNHQQLLCIVN